METTLLKSDYQPLDQAYIDHLGRGLQRRGYSVGEVAEIHRRAIAWIESECESHPVTGEPMARRRDYRVAVAEVLADSADLALRHFA